MAEKQYKWKKQKNTLGTYVMYDTGRNPQKNFGRHEGEVICFDASIERAVFMSKVDVKGFGGAFLFADNEERGYEPSDEVRDFWAEGTRSRLFRVKRHLRKVEETYHIVPKRAKERLQRAKELLAEGNDENVEGALCETLWAGEELVLFEADLKIAETGVRDDFGFIGCMKGFTDGGEQFKKYFKKVFKEAVIPTHWGCVEPYEQEKHYDMLFEMLDWCTENKIPVRGHALVWFSDWWEGRNWMARYAEDDFDAFKRLVVERAEFILGSRPNAFTSVDFNEPLQSNPFNFTFDQHFEICKEVCQVIRRLSPETKLMVNFYDEWQCNCGFDENSIPEVRDWKKSYGLPKSVPNRYCVSVPEFLDRCAVEGIKVDMLGLQFHDYPYDLFNTMEMVNWWYERYHLPVYLTEVSTPSQTGRCLFHMGNRPVPVTKYWHRPWDAHLQEEWYRKFSTLFYSIECVKGLTCWSLSDEPAQWGEFLAGHPNEKFRLQAFDFDGLLDFENKPKPAYHALCELNEEWGLKMEEDT